MEPERTQTNTSTNVDQCGQCPHNPFREDDEDIYTSEDGEPIEKVG